MREKFSLVKQLEGEEAEGRRGSVGGEGVWEAREAGWEAREGREGGEDGTLVGREGGREGGGEE